jgi:SSS family solute:Na+ symporter
MSPTGILLLVVAYFGLLILISFLTSGKGDNSTFFLGNRQSPWYVVAFGMIGASLSGVTFISVPGWVASSQFAYMQMVLGYLLGYMVIANVLLPLYYRLNLTSIYSYLEGRFGRYSYKVGAFYFLLSRTIGASFRLYLVAMVLQFAVFDPMELNVPFWLTVVITIGLIWLYTFRGGIKTIIWTDTLQTAFMLLSAGMTVYFIASEMNLDFGGVVRVVSESDYSQIWFFDDWRGGNFFWKQFLSGAFITIVMTGLDQDMMQKNLTCRNLNDAKKNMYWFSVTLVFVNMLFLALGALLYIYVGQEGMGIPDKADQLFPMVALQSSLPPVVGGLFILGLIAAAYSSADSALTSLTTSFSVDILGSTEQNPISKQRRMLVHLGFSGLLVLAILIFKSLNNESVISELFVAAGYTYGPLLGLYAFGLFSKYKVHDKWVPIICVISPILCYILKLNSEDWLWGYQLKYELLILNGLLTYAGLFLLRKS